MFQIDNSQLQCFKDCPRQYYNKYILRLKKSAYDERDLAQDFGKCIHNSLAIIYAEKNLDKALHTFKESFHGLDGEKCKTPANGLKLIEYYHQYYATSKNELSDTNLTTIAVETKGKFNLTDDIEYIVKLDRIVNSYAGIWAMEHKTTTKLGNDYFYRFDPNSQVSGYCYYCKLAHGQCSGIIINALAVGFREKAYRGEPAGFHCKFSRDIINRNNEQLEDWKTNAIQWINRLRASIEQNSFPKNEVACHSFKGCPYKEKCISCDDEQVTEELYEKYDPFKYLNE